VIGAAGARFQDGTPMFSSDLLGPGMEDRGRITTHATCECLVRGVFCAGCALCVGHNTQYQRPRGMAVLTEIYLCNVYSCQEILACILTAWGDWASQSRHRAARVLIAACRLLIADV
jgi:hypothetical protein